MSRTTREINRITSTIIGISFRLLFYALVFFLLYEGVTRGYSLGHEIFAPEAVAKAPGLDRELTIKEGESVSEVAGFLEKNGLIKNKLIFVIQSVIYNYEIYPGTYVLNTSMTSRDMLKLLDEQGIEKEKTKESSTKAASEQSENGRAAASDGDSGSGDDGNGGAAGDNDAVERGNTEQSGRTDPGNTDAGSAAGNEAADPAGVDLESAGTNQTNTGTDNTGAVNEDEAYESWW